MVYEEPGIRLLRVDSRDMVSGTPPTGLAPLRTHNIEIVYSKPLEVGDRLKRIRSDIELDSLVNRISEDSLISYTESLQVYRGLDAGTPPNYFTGSWAVDKFIDFGYDSVVVDTFFEIIDGRECQCRNIICYKIGNPYAHHQIVVGAHRDTENNCPGADDNLSGLSGVLEIARALAGLEINLTIIFILFDAEEDGLLGSWHYANRAAMQGDRIVMMFNMDMIGHYENSTDARYLTGDNTEYAQLWVSLANSIPSIGITGNSGGISGGSDHIPFQQNGYDFLYVSEYIHSTVYHTSSDSTTYLDYDYMRRMIMASLGTIYTVAQSYVPSPQLYLSYVQPTPSLLVPGESVGVEVAVEEYAGGVLTPGSVLFHYSISGGETIFQPMDELGGGIFQTDIAFLECGDRISFYVGADEIGGETFFCPDPQNPIQSIMATSVDVVFADDFESSQGWDVLGDASDGEWERGLAGEGHDIWTVPQYDFDGSGMCFLTGPPDWEDIDNGITRLFSPEIDVSGGEAMIEYARWYGNDLGFAPHTDVMNVFVYDRGAALLVETVGPVEQATGGWYTNKFWISDYFTPTYPIRLRFDASDLGSDSEVEAAVDAVTVTLFSMAPHIITEILPDGALGEPYTGELVALTCSEPLTWSDKYGDLAAIGLILSSEGLLTGIASDTGLFTFTAVAQDSDDLMSERIFSFSIRIPFLCGDANSDDQVNIGDAVFLISYIFNGGPEPYPPEAGDVNGDGEPNVGDAVYLISYIFKGGPGPYCP
jgi:hypothetical protein